MKKRGVIVAFEGKDRSAKTTHSKKLVEYLNTCEQKAVYVKSPHERSSFYLKIYSMLDDGEALRRPIKFQLLQFLNKLHFQTRVLPELLEQHDYVVLDRWDVSMRAYGLATGVPSFIVGLMSKLIVKPHQVILLHRHDASRDGRNDAYDSNVELQNKVSEYYDSLDWRDEYELVVDVNVAGDQRETFARVISSLEV